MSALLADLIGCVVTGKINIKKLEKIKHEGGKVLGVQKSRKWPKMGKNGVKRGLFGDAQGLFGGAQGLFGGARHPFAPPWLRAC